MIFYICLSVYVCLSLYHIDIDSIIETQTPSNSLVIIGSTTEYTIVTVSCTGLGSDTITISWSLNGNSINSATLPFAVSSSTRGGAGRAIAPLSFY